MKYVARVLERCAQYGGMVGDSGSVAREIGGRCFETVTGLLASGLPDAAAEVVAEGC